MKNLSAISVSIKSGFSLIELSIVLVIVGIMMFGTLEMYTYTAEKAKIDTTNTTLDAIERALKLYYATNSDLPCPANGTFAVTDTDFGLGKETMDGSMEACNYDNWLSHGGNASEGAFNDAAGGVVPTRTLNLPDSYMFDGWGNRITYVVSSPCTNSLYRRVADCLLTSGAGPTTKVYDNSDSDASTPTTMETSDLRTGNAAYVIISHGKNGIGAYRRNGGTARIPSTATTSVAEMENAHVNTTGGLATGGDAPNNTFRDDTIKDWEGVGTAYFDDLVRWKTAAQIAYTN